MSCATVLGQAGIELGLAIHLGEGGFEMVRRLSDAELHRDDFAYRAEFLLLSHTATRELPREHRQGPYALPAVGLRVVANATVPELERMKVGLRQFLAERGRR